MIRFGVLGPLRVDRDGFAVPGLNAPMLRRLLAALLCRANEAVPTDDLILALWGEDNPPSARKTLQVYVRRLRAALGDEQRIVHEPTGYRVEVAADELDTLEFEQLVEAGRRAPKEEAAALFGRALALWRGVAFEDVREYSPIVDEARRLDEERLRAEGEYAQVRLELGRHDELIPHLAKLTEAHPYREGLRGQLMLALYRAGRQSEALEIFRGTRKLLDDELGITPGRALQRLHDAILRTAPELDLAATRLPERIPRLLPADVNGFVGRQEDLAALNGLVGSTSAVVCAITGTAGVGKTALAVRWAHLVSDRFPDGQLYIDLNGFAESPPAEPVWALSLFLSALGVAPNAIPTEEVQAASLFRSVLAGRRMLVVLDNARSAEQVRPLLPGGSMCFVLVTSRNSLGGLVAKEGAHRINLEVLTPDEAESLLAAALGARLNRDDAAGVAELARSCAYLPLALRIAAANLREQPHRSVQHYVRRLDRSDKLDMLSIDGDAQTAVRGAFDLSYWDFPDEIRSTFRMLGLMPWTTFSINAVAAMTGAPVDVAESRLTRLAAAHLVQMVGPDRFGLHDLLRLYASGQARTEDSDDHRHTAWQRLCDWYVAGVDAAADVLYRDLLRLQSAVPTDETPARLMDPVSAAGWLEAESANLMTVIRRAWEEGPYPVTWLLADGLRGFWEGHTPLGEWMALVELAMGAAQKDANLRAQASMHLGIAHASRIFGDFSRAAEHLSSAMITGADWPALQTVCTGNLAGVSYEMGRLDQAELLVRRSLESAERSNRFTSVANATGNLGLVIGSAGRLNEAARLLRRGYDLHCLHQTGNQSEALCNLGTILTRLGETDEALTVLESGLALEAAEMDRQGQARFYVALTEVMREQGGYESALDLAARSIDIAYELGDRRIFATALNSAGSVYYELGEFTDALDAYRRASELARSVGLYEATLTAMRGEADSLRGLGEHSLALDKATHCLDAARESGHRFLEGQILTCIGQIHVAVEDSANASTYLTMALKLHRETGHRAGLDRTLSLLTRLSMMETRPGRD